MALKRTDPHRDKRVLPSDLEFQRLLVESDDRTAVIVGSTLLDHLLAEFVKRVSIPDEKLIASALDSRSPSSVLGSFSAKIKVMALFGKLSSDEAADLNTIRDIRNDFAHNIVGCDFRDPDVVAHTGKLILGWKAVKNMETPPRVVFNLETHILYGAIGARMLTAKSATPPQTWKVL